MAVERKAGGFGGKLREARERKGISLRDIANATKISTSALDALERNDISRLPGGIFSRAFVRSYAIEVGLDAEETIKEFIAQFPHDSVTAGHPTSAHVEDKEALESDRRMASTVLRLLLISVPIAGALMYFISRGSPAADAPPVQSSPAATVGSATAIPERRPVETTPAIAAPSDATASDAVKPNPAALQIEVSTTSRSWVSAIVDGQRVIAREMQPGERQSLEVKRDLVLSMGDAGAVALTLNGTPAKPLGKPGQVLTVQMNVTDFKRYLAAQ
jgi:cytoskeletal protein RodZ